MENNGKSLIWKFLWYFNYMVARLISLVWWLLFCIEVILFRRDCWQVSMSQKLIRRWGYLNSMFLRLSMWEHLRKEAHSLIGLCADLLVDRFSLGEEVMDFSLAKLRYISLSIWRIFIILQHKRPFLLIDGQRSFWATEQSLDGSRFLRGSGFNHIL